MSEFEIAGVKAKPGEMKTGTIRVGELNDGTPVGLPIIVVNGKQKGPMLLLIAGIHGTEIAGIESIRRVMREELKPDAVKGTVVALPLANPFAYNAGTYVTPNDGIDLSMAFPGSPTGTTARRLANILWPIMKESDFFIDLHCQQESLPCTIVRIGPKVDAGVGAKAMGMAKAFGVTITQPSPEALSRRPNETGTMELGIPSIVAELPEWRIWSRETAEIGVKGVLNVMRYLGLIEGEIEKQEGFTIFEDPLYAQLITANRGGVVKKLVDPGSAVLHGELIAEIHNISGDLVEEVKSPRKGFLLAWAFQRNQAVATGDWVAFIAYRD